MHGVSLGAVSLGAILAFLLIFLVARRVNIDEAAERAKEKSGLTGSRTKQLLTLLITTTLHHSDLIIPNFKYLLGFIASKE